MSLCYIAIRENSDVCDRSSSACSIAGINAVCHKQSQRITATGENFGAHGGEIILYVLRRIEKYTESREKRILSLKQLVSVSPQEKRYHEAD